LQTARLPGIPVNPGGLASKLRGENTRYADLEFHAVAVDMATCPGCCNRTDAVIDPGYRHEKFGLWLQIGVINHQGADPRATAGMESCDGPLSMMEILGSYTEAEIMANNLASIVVAEGVEHIRQVYFFLRQRGCRCAQRLSDSAVLFPPSSWSSG